MKIGSAVCTRSDLSFSCGGGVRELSSDFSLEILPFLDQRGEIRDRERRRKMDQADFPVLSLCC